MPVKSQQDTSIQQQYQPDHNKLQVFGNTSHITTNYKSTSKLTTKKVFGNTSQITKKCHYFETPVKSQQNTCISKHMSDHNDFIVSFCAQFCLVQPTPSDAMKSIPTIGQDYSDHPTEYFLKLIALVSYECAFRAVYGNGYD